jgi:hypothetical protein
MGRGKEEKNIMNRNYKQYLARKFNEYGNKFNQIDLDNRFIQFFETGTRIKVLTCGLTLTGTIGITSGWKPCFLLMRTRRSIGSSWTLGQKDKILAIQQPNGKYV